MKTFLSAIALVFVVSQTQAQQGVSTTRQPDTEKTFLHISPGGDHPFQSVAALKSVTAVRLSLPASDPHFEMWIARLAGCPQLETLILDNNRMEVLTPAVAQLTQLHTLQISNNPALHFEDAFRKLAELPALENLRLASNRMTVLPSSLGNLGHLKSLQVRDQQHLDWVGAVPVLKALPELHTLDVQVNDVTEFPSCVAQVASLQTVKISIGTVAEGSAETPAYVDAFRVPVENNRSLTIDLAVQDKPLSFSEEATLLHMLQQMTVRQSSSGYDYSNASGFKRSYKGVNAPIPSLDVKQTMYAVDAASGGELTYSSGTVISIPADAFVDAAGNPVKGAVTIDYREFRDPLDFIVSGIPMTYDTAGQTETFESAGMFEMNASVNGKEVFLAPGKKVDMAFSSTDAATSFNLYSYNATAGGWDMLDKAGKVDVDTNKRPKELSGAWKLFKPRYAKVQGLRDTVSFDNRYASENYFHTKRYLTKVGEKAGVEKHTGAQRLAAKTGIHIGKTRTARYLVKLKRVPCREKDKTCFKLDYDREYLPELNAFSGTVFVMEGKMKYSDFNGRYGTKMKFSDIRIQLDGDNAQLEMKSYKGYTTVNANLARLNPKDSIENIQTKTLASIRMSYNRSLNNRRKGVTRNVNDQVQRYNAALAINKKAGRKEWKRVQKYMSVEELAMSYDQWISYYTRLAMPQDNRPEVIRYLSVSGFGIYNCDQVERLEQAIFAKATFKDEQGLMQRSKTTYVIDGRMNGVLTYNEERGRYKYDANYFALDKSANTVLMMILADGKLGYVTAGDVHTARENRDGNKVEFAIKTVNPDEVSLDELRTRLGL